MADGGLEDSVHKDRTRRPADAEFQPALLDSPSPIVSLIHQLRDGWRTRATRGCPVYCSAHPSTPSDIWRDYLPQPASWGNSVLLHLTVLTIIVLPILLKSPAHQAPHVPETLSRFTHITLPPGWKALIGERADHGGGGGGDRSPLPASKGAIPPFTLVQLAPPSARIVNPDPVMPVPPSLVGRPDLRLQEMMTQSPWGDPNGVSGPESNGPGMKSGIGPGDGGGVGRGNGPGYGPGEGGNTGGDGPIFGFGSTGLTGPVAIYKPDPLYTEEARKAKHQGSVTLMVVVGPHGNVTSAQVVKSLGMGLDESAKNTVMTWRFKPGNRLGVPVSVRVMVDVLFRLF